MQFQVFPIVALNMYAVFFYPCHVTVAVLATGTSGSVWAVLASYLSSSFMKLLRRWWWSVGLFDHPFLQGMVLMSTSRRRRRSVASDYDQNVHVARDGAPLLGSDISNVVVTLSGLKASL